MAKGFWVKCDRCKGTGKISMSAIGRGLIGYLTIGLSEVIGTASTCSKCDGKGKVFKKNKDRYV